MRAIIFCFVFVLVAICCSNGAPVGVRKNATSGGTVVGVVRKNATSVFLSDSHVTGSKRMAYQHKKCKHVVTKKTKKGKRRCTRDVHYSCCGHLCPSQHQHEECDHDDRPEYDAGLHAGHRILNDDYRGHLLGEFGKCGYCHCRPLGPSGHGAHADHYDCHFDCHHDIHGCPCDHLSHHASHNLGDDQLPNMKCVNVGGDICLGLPHPQLQLCGEEKVERKVPPCCDIMSVNGHIALGVPHPELQLDCNQTVAHLFADESCHHNCHNCHCGHNCMHGHGGEYGHGHGGNYGCGCGSHGCGCGGHGCGRGGHGCGCGDHECECGEHGCSCEGHECGCGHHCSYGHDHHHHDDDRCGNVLNEHMMVHPHCCCDHRNHHYN